MKKLLILGAALLAAALIVLLLEWTGDEPGAGAPDVVGRGAAAVDAAASETETALRSEREAIAPAPPPPAPDAPPPGPPASFRSALGTLVGRVVEEDGRPVPGFPVALAGGRPSMFLPPADLFLKGDPLDLLAQRELDALLASTTTDAEGRFQLAEIEPRSVALLLLDAGGPRATFHELEQTPVSGQTRDVGDIVLPACATLTGKVFDDGGQPVAGARVRAMELPAMIPTAAIEAFAGWRLGTSIMVREDGTTFVFEPPAHLARYERLLPIPTCVTDEEGAFELPGVPPGLVTVAADADNLLAAAAGPLPTGAAGGRRDIGQIVLGSGVTLRGRVLDDRNQPIAGAEVMAGNQLPFVDATVLRTAGRTDAQGRFSFPGLRPTTAFAVARAFGRDDYFVSGECTPGADEAVVVVPAPRDARLFVTDEEGTPLSGVLFHGRVKRIPDEFVPMIVIPPRPLQAREDLPGHYLLAGLDPARWEFFAHRADYGTVALEVDLATDPGELPLRMQAAAVLAVRVLSDPQGEPVEWAQVSAWIGEQQAPITGVRTDASGLALLRDLPPGDLTLHVAHPAFAIFEQAASAPMDGELLVSLPKGGTIRGLVLEDGGAPSALRLITLEETGDGKEPSLPRVTLSGTDGSFQFANVQPGAAQLAARERHHLGGKLEGLVDFFANSPLAEAEVTVLPAEETDAVLIVGSAYADIDTAYVTGRVFVNHRPAEGWSVRTWGRIRRGAETAADGSFDLGVVEAGETQLAITPSGVGVMSGAILKSHSLTLSAGERRYVDIQVATGAISGAVISAENGRPIEGVHLAAKEETEADEWWGRGAAVSRADGSFLMEPIAAGTFRIHASAEGYASGASEPVEVRAEQEARGVEVRLQPALTVSGTLQLPDLPEEPQYMWLMASSEEGGTQDSCQVDIETHAFELDSLSPGVWKLQLATELGDEAFEPLTLEVRGNQADARLVFLPAAPPKLEILGIEVGEDGG